MRPDALIYKADGFSCDYISSIAIVVDDSSSEEKMNVEDLLPVEAVYGNAVEVKQPYYTMARIYISVSMRCQVLEPD